MTEPDISEKFLFGPKAAKMGEKWTFLVITRVAPSVFSDILNDVRG